MPRDKRFIDEEELEGRTVKKVVFADNQILMLFTDGTFTKIGLTGGDGWYTADTILTFDDWIWDNDYEALGLKPDPVVEST